MQIILAVLIQSTESVLEWHCGREQGYILLHSRQLSFNPYIPEKVRQKLGQVL